MATITNTIRWADNTEELKRNLLEGIGTIDAMKTSVDRLVNSLSGQGLLQAANRATAAVDQLGGVTKLTRDQQEQHVALLGRAIERMELMGRVVPPMMQEQYDAAKKLTGAWSEFVENFKLEDAITNPLGTAKNALSALASTMGTTAVQALAVGTAFVTAGLALFKLTSHAASAGAELDDMADKTGMSVPALSKLSVASEVAGTSLAAMTDIVFKLEQGLAAGGKAFEEGLGKMSLSTEQLKAAGPDHYLELVVMGLQSIADPAERAAAGTAVLGKGYRDVAASLNDLGRAMELTADIDVWTAQDAAAAEEFGFAVASLKVHIEQLAIGIGKELIPAVTTLVEWLPAIGKAIKFVVVDMTGLGAAFEKLRSMIDWTGAAWDVLRGKMQTPINLNAVEEAKKKLQKLRDDAYDAANAPDVLVERWKTAARGMAATIPDATAAFNTAALAERELTEAATDSIAVHKKQAEQVKKVQEEHEKFTKSVTNLTTATLGFVTNWGVVAGQLPRATTEIADAREEMDRLTSSTNEFHNGLSVAGDTVATVAIPLFTTLPNVVAQNTKAFKDAGTETKTFSQTLNDAFENLPQTISAAFTGGGGVGGALKSFGAQIGGSLFGAFSGIASKATSGLTSMFGKTIGGALGAAIPGIGALIGPGLQMLWGGIKKLFGGPSQEELQARATVKQFEAQLAGMLTLQQQAEAGGRQWAATTIAVRDAFLATGRSAEEAEQVTLRLWDTKNPEAYKGAITEINAALNEQAADQQRAKELITEYGISIEQLGPKFRAQQLGEQAKGLMTDFRLMVDVLGVEAPTAMTLMSEKMNAFVQEAIKGSVEIPANMEPMLQQMADMGLLTDESGNKITDLSASGLTFAETFSQGVDRIVEKFDQLMDRLGLVPDALNDIPAQKNIDVNYNVHWNVPPMPQPNESVSYGAQGGLVGAHGVQYFPNGGSVLPFAPRGSDTVPAMLTPGEGVLSRGDMMALGGPGGFRAFRRNLHMGGGGGGDSAVLGALLESQQRTARYMATEFKTDIARAIRDEVQKARAS